MQRTTLKLDKGHLIGNPQVVIGRDDVADVWVHNKPWGWRETEREFLNRQSASIEHLTEDLLGRISAHCEREAALQNQRREASRSEGPPE